MLHRISNITRTSGEAFGDLPLPELEEIAARLREIEIEIDAGTNVVTLDDYGTAVYFIEQGEAVVRDDRGEETRAPSAPVTWSGRLPSC